jgi:hypothetical protein
MASSSGISERVLETVGNLLSSKAALRDNVTWKRLLNNHLSRAKKAGGRICDEPVEGYLVFEMFAEQVNVQLTLPHSFDNGDNAASGASVYAEPQAEGIEKACKAVLTELFIRDVANYPNSRLVLHQTNWKSTLADLLQQVGNLVRAEPTRQPLAPADPWQPVAPADTQGAPAYPRPLPIPPSHSEQTRSLYKAPVDEAERVSEVLRLLRFMVRNDRGRCQLAKAGPVLVGGRKVPAWKCLARLVEPGKLLSFLQNHGG